LDQLAVTSFTTGGAAQLVEHARGLAEALAGPDGDGTRRRTIVRALAVTHTQMDLIDTAAGEALGRRDLEVVRVLTKLADSMTRRFEMLLEEHRIELGRDKLPMVRAQKKPAQFREARSIRLEKFGFTVEVNLARVPSPTSYGGERVFFKCPRSSCGSLVNVLGCAMWVGWGCTRCLRWRGRNRLRIVTPPPLPWAAETGRCPTGKADVP